MSTATTTTQTCSRCGSTRFGVFAGPSGRKRRCRDCAQPVEQAYSFEEFLRTFYPEEARQRGLAS